MKLTSLFVWTSALTAACSSIPTDSRDNPRGLAGAEAVPAVMDSTAQPEPAAAPEVVPSNESRSPSAVSASSKAADPQHSRRDARLALLRTASFQRHFSQSLLAETEIEPRVTENERDTMLEVIELIAGDELEDALRRLQEDGGDGASAVFDFTEAHVHYLREENPAAIAAYRRATDKYPKFRRAWQGLGQSAFKEGDLELAREALTRVIALGGGESVTYGLLGMAYAGTGRHVAAESAFRMAALLDPDTIEWKMGLAQSFFNERRYEEAAALCDGLIAEQPDVAKFWLIQGNAYVGMNKPMNAAQNFEMVERLGGSTPASLSLLGTIYINEKLLERARVCFERALTLDPPGQTRGSLRAAKDLIARGGGVEGLRLVDRIEELRGDELDDESRKEILHVRARVADDSGRTAEQLEILRRIVELDPLDGDALIALGDASAEEADVAQAVFYYERAGALEDFEARASIRQAKVLVNQDAPMPEDYARAIGLLTRAQTLDPRPSVQEYLDAVEKIARNR